MIAIVKESFFSQSRMRGAVREQTAMWDRIEIEFVSLRFDTGLLKQESPGVGTFRYRNKGNWVFVSVEIRGNFCVEYWMKEEQICAWQLNLINNGKFFLCFRTVLSK